MSSSRTARDQRRRALLAARLQELGPVVRTCDEIVEALLPVVDVLVANEVREKLRMELR